MSDLDVFEAIARRRRSVRAFLETPVKRALIERAIAIAGMAPSSCNTQPWRLHIISGVALDAVRIALVGIVQAGDPPRPEVDHAAPYRGVYRDRQIDAAIQLFAAQGIARHDEASRNASFLRNYACFDAPHVALLYLPHGGGTREAADCGKFAQTFMLALAAAGIGSCPQASLSDYPDAFRESLRMQEDGKLLLGISFGYADNSHETADARTKRAEIDAIARFHDLV